MSDHRHAPVPLAEPVRFLVASSVLVSLLLWVWWQVGGAYLTALVAIANAILHTLAVPVVLNPPPAAAAATVVHPEMVGIAALFACTPRRGLRWRVLWLGTVLLGLALLQAGLLAADSWQAYRLLDAARASPAGAAPNGGTGLARQWLPTLAGLAAWFGAVGR